GVFHKLGRLHKVPIYFGVVVGARLNLHPCGRSELAPLAEEEGKPMEDRALPALGRELPLRQRPSRRRYPRGSTSPTRRPRRGAQRQSHQVRRFSVPIRTRPIARGSPASVTVQASALSSPWKPARSRSPSATPG